MEAIKQLNNIALFFWFVFNLETKKSININKMWIFAYL